MPCAVRSMRRRTVGMLATLALTFLTPCTVGKLQFSLAEQRLIASAVGFVYLMGEVDIWPGATSTEEQMNPSWYCSFSFVLAILQQALGADFSDLFVRVSSLSKLSFPV
jgi:hypothetical protein